MLKSKFCSKRPDTFTLSLENKFYEWRFAGSYVQNPSGAVLLLMWLGRHIDKCQCPSFSCAWLKTMSYLSLFQRTQYNVSPVPVSAEVNSIQCSSCPCFSWGGLKTMSYLSLFQRTQYNVPPVPVSAELDSKQWPTCPCFSGFNTMFHLSLFQLRWTQNSGLPVLVSADSVQCSTCPCFIWAWLKTMSYLSLFQRTQYNLPLVPVSTDSV